MRVAAILLALALSSLALLAKEPKQPLPPARFKALTLDILGPNQQAWLVQDVKHPDQCVLVLESVGFIVGEKYSTAETRGMVSQPWPCQ